ncbi:M23 family metallopeptidase [Actinomadura xylanilytica]|uniref:M23 family metallopeptidase n=1 Tax=Actinomadura xylanilytica TaxID=887459 RepID=UPI00255AF056|nr:M23 family metallopeptidase [Actinomadura xylanilytica]MDL4773978.1 M23 family metallopeptidase [Actinomadura xylanilytica]
MQRTRTVLAGTVAATVSAAVVASVAAPAPAGAALVSPTAATAATAAVSPVSAGEDPYPDRPDFRLPFGCDVKVLAQTYEGHDTTGKKIDMYRYGMTTGSPIRASADGVVHELFAPGGLEIRHGEGWFTTYMHMTRRVKAGTKVKRHQVIGYMSDVGAEGRPHLHYEQLYNPGHDDADNEDMVNAIIQGRGPINMLDETPIENWTSTNCV